MSKRSITVDVKSASSAAAFLPFTAVPDDWAGKRVTVTVEDLLQGGQPDADPDEATPAMIAAGGHVNSEWLNDNAPLGEERYARPMAQVWKAMRAAIAGGKA